jgi:signal transduction histidine kinase
VITSSLFVVRIVVAWGLALLLGLAIFANITGQDDPAWPFVLVVVIIMLGVFTSALTHVRRVKLIAGHLDANTLGNRQRRQVEIPLEAGEAFDLVDAAIRELPNSEQIESARDSLQVRAKVRRVDPYRDAYGYRRAWRRRNQHRNQVLATVTPNDGAGSLTLICEPEAGAWSDWFRVDDGTNLENAEAITRAITRRVAERRRNEEATTRQTVTEKENTEARLGLLQAQVEPHFLYNTLASTQVLVRTDPARADRMLGHLIAYLRRSLPCMEDALSTIGDELERTCAYLEIMKIRMGDRLALQIDVPETLKTVPFPAMMLQTLVENAIKHGLEAKPGGGKVWVLARPTENGIAVTVADDGQGFTTESSGTGIGLKNLRERLRLVYGTTASFAIVANFPSGVAATVTVPASAGVRHA